MEKEWLEERFQGDDDHNKKNGDENNDDDDHDSLFSIDSNDTLHNFIEFQSHRNSTGLEEAISFSYPFQESMVPCEDTDVEANVNNADDDADGIIRKRTMISTLLEEDDLVPIFDGAGWAGTRVWAAAIWGIKYLVEEYGNLSVDQKHGNGNEHGKKMTLCELGCGLGVPGMIWHQLGGDVVLTEQEKIMSQLRDNVKSNFKDSYVSLSSNSSEEGQKETSSREGATICAHPLDWSREGYQELLNTTGFRNGFDIVLNCDCVYEPLYGKSWELLVDVIDECLKTNPKCCVVTSVERRSADGIDDFVEKMKSSEFVGNVEKVLEDKPRKLELYITSGIR